MSQPGQRAGVHLSQILLRVGPFPFKAVGALLPPWGKEANNLQRLLLPSDLEPWGPETCQRCGHALAGFMTKLGESE